MVKNLRDAVFDVYFRELCSFYSKSSRPLNIVEPEESSDFFDRISMRSP